MKRCKEEEMRSYWGSFSGKLLVEVSLGQSVQGGCRNAEVREVTFSAPVFGATVFLTL